MLIFHNLIYTPVLQGLSPPPMLGYLLLCVPIVAIPTYSRTFSTLYFNFLRTNLPPRFDGEFLGSRYCYLFSEH